MDPARWDRIERLFGDALERPADARAAFLREACAGDEELRGEVERLLARHDDDPAFLESATPWQGALDSPEHVVEGRRLGAYRLVRPLGRGGMGEVFLAVHEGDGFERPVAVKVIRRGMDTDEVLRRFHLERRMLASLSHANIAPLLDGGATDDGLPFLVMEYVEGTPVDVYCDRQRMGVEQRLVLFLAVCDAVQHAHQNLVIHRDLKPSNILVTAEGVPKLLDFGIGKLLDYDQAGDDAPTRTGMRMLTPENASPEQVRGEPVTVASDVYGLGVLLYRLLTGTSPYGESARTPTEVERAVLEHDPRRPSTLVRARRLAGDLDVIVLKALRKEPERRYGSATALADDLRRHLEGLPVRARPATFGYRAGKFVRRNGLPLTAGAVVFLALSGATVYSAAQSRRVAAERDKALEVRSFLLEMFGATAPDQATGDTVTARQLLDRQVGLLETSFEEPVLRAEMLSVLAEGYDRLGLFADAEPLARSALDLRRASLAAGHSDVAASLNLLGWILHEMGDSEEGEALLRQAVPLWRRAPDGAVGLSRALNDLGVIRDAAGEYDEAESLYAEALELRRVRFGEGHRSFATTASNLSVIRYRKGDLAGAVTAATEALTAMRQTVGADHQRSMIIQSNLAAMRAALGDDPGAEAQYRDLMARQERIRGGDDPVTLRVVSSLATTLTNQGKFGQAEPLYRRALAAQEGQLGSDHPEVGRTLVRLGQAVTGMGDTLQARRLLDRGLTIYRATVGPTHPVYAEALESVADAWEHEDPAKAEALHREAIGVLDARLGAGNLAATQARLRLADRLKVRGGRDDEALALYDSAYVVFAGTLPPSHRDLHRTRVRNAEVSYRLGDLARADSLLNAAVEGFALGGAADAIVALHDTLRVLVDKARVPRAPRPR
jgi:serine/threonine-protein kinase